MKSHCFTVVVREGGIIDHADSVASILVKCTEQIEMHKLHVPKSVKMLQALEKVF